MNMRKIVSVVMLSLLAVGAASASAWADGPRRGHHHGPHAWRGHHHHHHAPPRVVYAPPPRVVYAPPPVYYAPPPPVMYQPAPSISLVFPLR
jgi:hypothetical protein